MYRPTRRRMPVSLTLVLLLLTVAGTAVANASLPVKNELPNRYDGTVLPSEANPSWTPWILGDDAEKAHDYEKEFASVTNGVLRVDVPEGISLRWINASPDGFAAVDPSVGATAEIRLQVTDSTGRGIDFEVQTADEIRYILHIAPNEVRAGRWHETYAKLNTLDQASSMTTFRIAIRQDQYAEVYRNGELIGILQPQFTRDKHTPGEGPFLQWGQGQRVTSAVALIDYVAFDLTGAYRPQ